MAIRTASVLIHPDELSQKWIRRAAVGAALAVMGSLAVWSGPRLGAALAKQPGLFSFLVYLETGRVMGDPQKPAEPSTVPTEPPAPTESTAAPEPVLTLSAEDLEDVSVLYRCDYRPALEPLIQQPLDWDLTDGEPAVLILHTHGSECYTPGPGESFSQQEPYRTLDNDYNMISLGKELAQLLEAGGIRVIHDTRCHDDPDYNRSYINARAAIEEYLRQYPTIRMVLDLHRDASDDPDNQLITAATVGGQRSAQLLLMTGTDAGGNEHPNWQENLALGLKLTAVLEQAYPGICRPVTLRSERFNTDLTPGSLLVEVGAAGNTREEARIAIHALADGILTLAKGANR